MKYSSIHIKNFRAIDMLDIHNFEQVNLITGRNNCGKTTLLEALFQISGMSNSQLPLTINSFRDLAPVSADNFNVFFHNLDFNQEPHISAMLDGSQRTLTIKPKYAAEYNNKVINTEKINSIAENKTIVNDYDFSIVNGILLELRI